MNFTTTAPQTIIFAAPSKGVANIYFNGKLFAVKPFEGGQFKYNLPDAGKYFIKASQGLKIVKIGPLQIVEKNIALPIADRNKTEGIKNVYFDNESNSPARIQTDKQIILVNKQFFNYPIEVRIFILLHEVGHFYYSEEWACDTYAAHHFLKMGYNPSQAFESLAGILHPNQRNDDRIENIYNLLKK